MSHYWKIEYQENGGKICFTTIEEHMASEVSARRIFYQKYPDCRIRSISLQ